MKAMNCVELKNRIQEEIVKKYASLPKSEWARHQAEELAKSPHPMAVLWRRIQPATGRSATHVAEGGAGYTAVADVEKEQAK